MKPKESLRPLSVGETVYVDGLWNVISDIDNGEYELLSISADPKKSFARIDGVSIYGKKDKANFITGKPRAVLVSRSNTTVMDTVFFIFKGNQGRLVVDWGYYLSMDNRFMTLHDKTQAKTLYHNQKTPIQTVFFFQ